MGQWKDVVHKLIVQVADDLDASGRKVNGTKQSGMIVDQLEYAIVRAMAIEWLAEQARAFRRGETLSVERAAEVRLMPEMVSRDKQTGWWYSEEGRALKARQEAKYEAERIKWDGLAYITVEKIHKNVILDFNAKLRESKFAMPDGSQVAWGEATVEQHSERIEMLMKNAMGNIDAAQRHRTAIEEILTNGAKCLNDLEGVAA